MSRALLHCGALWRPGLLERASALFLRRRVPENGPLKAAVIGAGAFGRHHCRQISRLPMPDGVELFAIADPSAEVRRAAVAQYGVLAVADWRELLGKVDLVSICSPAVTHAEIVRAFLNAGAHVLVEKPIATTIEEANDLVALARQTGRVLTVGHQERFVFARTGLLDQAEAPLEIQCWRRGPWTGRGDDVSAVLDLMIHDLDLVHTLVRQRCRRRRRPAASPNMVRMRTKSPPPSPSPTAPWRGWTPAASPRPASAACARSMPTAWSKSISSPAKSSNTTPARRSRRWKWAIRWANPWPASSPRRATAPRRWCCAEQARQALETALLIDEAAEAAMPAAAPASRAARVAAAS